MGQGYAPRRGYFTMSDFASLVILSYNRKDFLRRSLESLWANTDSEYELIVVDDASNAETQEYIFSLVRQKKVSTALFNVGWNRGIGIAVNRGVAASRGNILFKLDADLLYHPGWLREARRLLTIQKIGCLGLFRYNYPPCRWQDELNRTDPEGFDEVKDFVGSAIGFRREMYDRFGPWTEEGWTFSEDVKKKKEIQAGGYLLALPKDDLAVNFGFGENLTSLIRKIDWKGGKHEYNIPVTAPLLFGGAAQTPPDNKECADLRRL